MTAALGALAYPTRLALLDPLRLPQTLGEIRVAPSGDGRYMANPRRLSQPAPAHAGGQAPAAACLHGHEHGLAGRLVSGAVGHVARKAG